MGVQAVPAREASCCDLTADSQRAVLRSSSLIENVNSVGPTSYTVAEILAALGVAASESAAERLMHQGRVRLNDVPVVSPFALWPGGRQTLSLNGRRCAAPR